MSSAGSAEVSECDRVLHRQAEKSLKEAKAKLALQVKVLLLGSGDSGKSTILKQMRLIHRVPFSPQETESFRQLVFDNLTRGLKYLLDALPDMALELPPTYTPPEGEGKRLGWEEGASIEVCVGSFVVVIVLCRSGVSATPSPFSVRGGVLSPPLPRGPRFSSLSLRYPSSGCFTRERRRGVASAALPFPRCGTGVSRLPLPVVAPPSRAHGLPPLSFLADVELIATTEDLRDGEAFPVRYLGVESVRSGERTGHT
ncbi:G-protein alpha subunit-domain-containing protein [Mycena latifolia]|nr:G-protein alpha subunit-domain-containing protein [Mycena latifolia]